MSFGEVKGLGEEDQGPIGADYVAKLSSTDAARLLVSHGRVMQQVLAGLDPASVKFPNTSAKWWLNWLHDPFSERVPCYQLSEEVGRNVDEWLKRSGWLALYQRTQPNKGIVLLTNMVATCDSVPVLKDGQYGRMFVGNPDNIMYPAPVQDFQIEILYGRKNFIWMGRPLVDVYLWLQATPPPPYLVYQKAIKNYPPVTEFEPRLLVEPDSGKGHYLPGGIGGGSLDDIISEDLTKKIYGKRRVGGLPMLGTAGARQHRLQLRGSETKDQPTVALSSETKDQPAPQYYAYDFLGATITADRVLSDQQIPEQVRTRLAQLVAAAQNKQQVASLIYHALRSSPNIQQSLSQLTQVSRVDELVKAAVTIIRANLTTAPLGVSYILNPVPAEGTLTTTPKIRLFSPLYDQLLAKTQTEFKEQYDRKLNSRPPGQRIQEIRKIVRDRLERSYRGITREVQQGTWANDRDFSLNQHYSQQTFVTLNAYAVSRVFVNTPLASMATDARGEVVSYDKITLADAQLIQDFLAGRIMLGVLAGGLSPTASVIGVLGGYDTLLEVYEHIPSRLLIDRCFVFGLPFLRQLEARVKELSAAGSLPLNRYLLAIGLIDKLPEPVEAKRSVKLQMEPWLPGYSLETTHGLVIRHRSDEELDEVVGVSDDRKTARPLTEKEVAVAEQLGLPIATLGGMIPTDPPVFLPLGGEGAVSMLQTPPLASFLHAELPII